MVYNHITELIGNTPLLKIDPSIHGLKNIDLYAKLEMFNPFGSLKDRIAWGLIKDDIDNIVNNNLTIIESSSGNTAKALQVLASIFGANFKTVTNRIKVPEVKGILKFLGADIFELPGLSECHDPTDPNDPLVHINNMLTTNGDDYFYTTQYTNEKNPKSHYDSTGVEIYNDIGNVDYIFGGLGTTGSTQGTAMYLQEKNPNLIKVGIISSKGDTIPGIRNVDEMYEVGIYNKDFYNDSVVVDSMEAIESTLILNRKLGLLAGPTSGATFNGTLKYLKKVDSSLITRKKAVFMVCDRLEWYISYMQKRRPDIFNLESKQESIRTLTENELNSTKTISLEDAPNWIEKNTPLIIDLRGSLAFKTNHIKNSINILDSYFEEIVDSGIPFSNEQIVLLVCPVGENSKKFGALLNKKGFQNVYSLENGVVGWRDCGYPLERSNIKKL